MARKQHILAIADYGTECAFDRITAHLDGAVVTKQLQAIHVFGNAAEGLTKARLCGDAGALGFEPDLEVRHQGFGLVLLCSFTPFG